MRCPTCRAEQEWSDTCRRCKTDLRLLRSMDEACRNIRAAVLRHLRDGRHADALHTAQHLSLLSRDDATARLLAVCYLLCGQPERALRVARPVVEDSARDCRNPA